MLIDHNPREHWKIIQICTFCHRNHKHHNNSEISIQTTRNAWLLSTNFASQESSCQHLWKTSQAWASTHHTTSACAETTLCLSSHLFSLHLSSPALRVSPSAPYVLYSSRGTWLSSQPCLWSLLDLSMAANYLGGSSLITCLLSNVLK